MKKQLFALLACVVLLTAICTPMALADNTDVDIYIDGILLDPPIETILQDGTSYVSLKAFCEAFGLSAKWDADAETLTVTGDGINMKMTAGASYMTANGRYLYFLDGSIFVDDTIMVPVRQAARALGASVYWSGYSYTVYVTSGSKYIESGDTFYDSSSVYWLSRIIFAESGNQSLEGQIAVGNVVMNRVASSSYPDTIYNVIFDRRGGSIQFSPAYSGSIYNTPSESAVIAAKIALEGYSVVGDSLFFFNPAISSAKWITSTRTYVTSIGSHAFYA